MVALGYESQSIPYTTNFILAVVDRCDDSEQALFELRAAGLPSEDVQLFYGDHGLRHTGPAGVRLAQLSTTLKYLGELLCVDWSWLADYEKVGPTGRHVLLAKLESDERLNAAAVCLTNVPLHMPRILGSWHIGSWHIAAFKGP